MSENLKDILSNLNPDIDQETLLQYLQGKLSAQEQHEVEKKMMDNDFNADALEGLQEFKDKKNITTLVDQLNTDLKRRTEKKKRFKEKWRLNLDSNLIIAVVIILLLIVLSYFIIHKLLTKS
jgi:membrane-bound ClpP family serine protease